MSPNTSQELPFILQNKDYIEFIAGIGTFLSAVIAAYTLYEIKKQRSSTYKPELLLNSFCVIPVVNPLMTDQLVKFKVGPYNDYSTRIDEASERISVLYKLENLGFGVAQNINCKWEFDHIKASSILTKLLSSDYQLHKPSDSDTYYLQKKSDNDFHRSASLFHADKYKRIDFIAPVHVKDHSNLHSLPDYILFFYYYILIFKYDLTSERAKQFYLDDFEDMPKPRLKINYRDLNGKKYKKTCTLKVSVAATQIEEVIDASKEFCVFYFNVESVKYLFVALTATSLIPSLRREADRTP